MSASWYTAFVIGFVVVDGPGQPPILGLPSFDQLNIIRRVDAIQSPPTAQLPRISGVHGRIYWPR